MMMLRRERYRWHRPLIVAITVLSILLLASFFYYQNRINSLEEEMAGLRQEMKQEIENASREVGKIDLQQIIAASPRAQGLQEELDRRGMEIEEEFQAQAEDLSPEERQQLQQEAYDRYLEAKEELEADLTREIEEILQEIAEEKGLDLIIARQGIHLGGQDITPEVLERME